MDTSSSAVEPLYSSPEGTLHPAVLEKFRKELKGCIDGDNVQEYKLMALFNVSGLGRRS